MFWKEILITNYTQSHTLEVSFPINNPKRQDVLRLKLEHHEKMSYHMSTVSNLDKISYQAFFVYSSQSTYIQFYHAFLIIKVYIIKRAPFVRCFPSFFFYCNFFFQKWCFVWKDSLFYLQQHQCMSLNVFISLIFMI